MSRKEKSERFIREYVEECVILLNTLVKEHYAFLKITPSQVMFGRIFFFYTGAWRWHLYFVHHDLTKMCCYFYELRHLFVDSQ